MIQLIGEYRFQSLDSAMILSQHADNLSEPFKGKAIYADLNYALGLLALSAGDFETSLVEFLNAIVIWESTGQDSLLFKPYLNIGWIYFNMGQLDKSQSYLETAESLAKKRGDDDQLMRVRINQATIFMYMGEQQQMATPANADSAKLLSQKSEIAYKEVIELAKRLQNYGNWASALNNLVVMKSNAGDLAEALSLAYEAEKISKQSGEIDLIVQSKYNLAYALLESGKPTQAIEIGEKGLAVAKERGMKRKQGIIEEMLYQAYQKVGNYEKANTHLETYLEYYKESSDIESKKQVAEVESQFQLVQKEKEILELENEKNKAEKQRDRLIIGGVGALILGFLIFQLNKIRKDRNDRQAFTEALIFAQEEERKRIASDLHDGVGQSLLLLKKQMEIAYENTLENQSLISDTLEEVRSISRDLHPFQLEKFGLEAAVKEAIYKIEKSTDLFITQAIPSIDYQFSQKEEIQIYRTIQEALNNIVKHSEASAAKISFEPLANELLIKVQDNGKGFAVVHYSEAVNSLGLRTMQERIASIGGVLSIDSQKPKGTLVEIKIPLHAS
ncbi:MAG: ATP-binding protein [Bacteroidota bacterium]